MRQFSLSLLVNIILSAAAFAGIREEVPVGPPFYGNAPGEQSSGMIASNGDTFLAAWSDEREGRSNFYAARIGNNGELLDPTDIRIATSPTVFNRSLVNVLATVDGYVVLWNEQVFFPNLSATLSEISAVRIDRDGNVIDGPHVVLENAFAARRGAASSGTRIVIAYNNRYALLDPKLNVLQRDIALPVVPQQNTNAAQVASNGSGFMISWGGFIGMYGETDVLALDANGNSLGMQRFGMAVPAGLASNGSDYLVAYQDLTTRQFLARRVTSNVEAFDVPQPIPQSSGITTGADLAWSGSVYMMAVSATQEPMGPQPPYQQLFGVRLDASGKSLDSDPVPLSDPAYGNRTLAPSIASNGRSLVALWHSGASDIDTYATLVNPASLQRSNPILLSRSANAQYQPAIASSGRNHLVVWSEASGLYAGRLSLDGERLDGRGVQLSPTGGSARVIFDDANYVVAWVTGTNNLWTLWTNRIVPETGEVLDGIGVPIATASCAFSFDLANGASNALMAWDECRYAAIRVARLDRTARAIDVSHVITPDNMRTAAPVVAWSGSEYLVAFQEQINIPSPILIPGFEAFRSNVRAVRLSPELTVLDTEPIAIAVSDKDDQAAPRVASNGTNFMIGWTVNNKMLGRWVAIDGPLTDTISIGDGTLSSVVWDGLRYAAAFTLNSDVFATHVGTGDRLIISASGDDQSLPRLATTGDGNITASYIRVATERLYGGVSRAFVRQPSPARGRAIR